MKKYAAEFLGTFALVFAGTGAIIINHASDGMVTHVGISLTFGLVVLAMIYTVGDISGAHLNPVVSLGFFAAKRFQARELVPYVVSQCAGAFAASGILRLLFPTDATLGTTLPAGPAMQSFVLELILTAILMFVILGVSTGAAEKGITAGIAVGAVIGLEAMFAGPICGASMKSCPVPGSRDRFKASFEPLDLLDSPCGRRFACCHWLSLRARRRLLRDDIHSGEV